MNTQKRLAVIGSLLILILLANGCNGDNYQEVDTTIVEETVSQPCQGTPESTSGEFSVEPLPLGGDNQVCVQLPADSWETMGIGPADWEYGLGTFLDAAAAVYFPGGEGEMLMLIDTQIQLPDAAGGTLELVGGTIELLWTKIGDYIGAITAGGDDVDPDFAMFSLSYDPDKKITELRVYAGEAILTRRDTDQEWRLTPWQILSLDAEAAQAIRANLEPASPEMTALLEKQGVPVLSPWVLDPILDRDPVLDWIWATDLSSQRVLVQLMEGLTRVGPEGEILPGGAKSWEVSDDGLVYTFFLREDAVWSDGKPVFAQEYVDGICRAADPESQVEQAALLYFIAGLEGFHRGDIPDCAKTGVQAVDDYTLSIELVEPLAEVANLLAISLASPTRMDLLSKCGNEWTEPDCFASNGPYRLESWAHNELLVLEKNPFYWDTDQVKPDFLEFKVVQN